MKIASKEDPNSSEDDFTLHVMKHLSDSKVQKIKHTSADKNIRMTLNDVDIRMEPDSGADINLMDEQQIC